MSWRKEWRPPRCQCFDLCTTADVLNFYKRLPLEITNTRSPWYNYLSQVYIGNRIPLPFDLRQLELFYPGLMPTSTHLCTNSPFQVQQKRQQLPSCANDYCSNWLRNLDVAENDSAVKRLHPRGWARGASHIWTPIQDFWSGNAQDRKDLVASGAQTSRLRLTGRHLFVALQRNWIHRKTLYADHTWVEVMRVSVKGEGGDYGCWFWPLRGSGIFVNVGRSLRSPSKHALAQQLDTPPHDRYFPNQTASRGYDSFQAYYGGPQYGGRTARFHIQTVPAFEIVLTGSGCVDKKRPKLRIDGPCVPALLRTSWNATTLCECDNTASPLLNCMKERLE
jgi:hypothetical protein